MNATTRTTRQRGLEAEIWARDFLRQKGLALVATNYAAPCGELDIIAKEKDGCLVFVEVRYRKNTAFGQPYETIDKRKQKKIHATALHFLQSKGYGLDHACRVDIISITRPGDEPVIQWIKNALQS